MIEGKHGLVHRATTDLQGGIEGTTTAGRINKAGLYGILKHIVCSCEMQKAAGHTSICIYALYYTPWLASYGSHI